MTRPLVKLHRARGKRYFYSKLNGCDVHPESLLERNFAIRQEFCDQVVEYACQPETAHGETGERSPDFLLEYADGTFEYIEVHREKDVDDEYREELNEFNLYFLATSQRPFRLVLDTEMCDIETDNLNFLYEYRHIGWPHKPINLPESITFGELLLMCEQQLTLPVLESKITALTLLADKHYEFNLSEDLNNDTLLRKR
ncbi:hypothetical protein [Pseudoalteromonas sp. NCCP-2140]|uniref:hypothetical protein n=1 Tax=Pseudoalteromonas sp. NCCP-2140 TaxID=2942288 RepID=UPI00203BCE6F|nr:hypothetical protein [Pseudoalteromonas sp. NCCP-2140]